MIKRPSKGKIGFYFDARAVADNAQVLALLTTEVARRLDRIPSGVSSRIGKRIANFLQLPHHRVMAGSPKAPDFACQFSSDDSALRNLLEETIASINIALGDLIDRSQAFVFVGREITITAGDGPIYNIMPLRRISTLSHNQFMSHWFDDHAALGEKVAGVRYRQNHIDQRATNALALRLGLDISTLDGITESYFDSVDAAIAILSHSDVALGAISDEQRFIDHQRSQFAIYQTVY